MASIQTEAGKYQMNLCLKKGIGALWDQDPDPPLWTSQPLAGNMVQGVICMPEPRRAGRVALIGVSP
jgi:hypothetical protein